MYQNLHVNFNLGLKNTSKMKNVENLHEIHPSDSCSRADNSVIFQFWLMIMGMHHIQYVSVYIPLRYDQISKNLHVQHLLKEGTPWPKSGIPDFQNNVKTRDVSGKRVWYSWSAQHFDSRNVNKVSCAFGHQNFVAQWKVLLWKLI